MAGSNEKLRVLRRIPEIRFDEELRGYNKHQVDRVLENLAPLADEVDTLVSRLSEAERRAAAAEARVMEGGGPAPIPPAPTAPVIPPPTAENFDETLSKTLLLAQRTADTTVQEAKEEASRIRADVEAEAAATREAANVEAASVRKSAEDERAASIEQANREVAAMIDAARATIDAKVAEAEAELAESHVATRDELVEQIASLQRSRDALALDVEHFEGHLVARRDAIRTAIAELNDVVEHPERLRTVMPPSPVADAEDVDPGGPIEIEVNSLDTLASAVTDEAASQGVLAPDLALGDAASGSDDPGAARTDAATSAWADGESTWADGDDAGASGFFVDESDDTAEASDDGDPTLAVPAVVDVDGDELPVRTALRDLGDDGPESASLDADAEAADGAGIIDSDAIDGREALGEQEHFSDIGASGADADEGSNDPFLDELRRVTTDDEDDEALSKFLTDAEVEEQSKGGWFGRRK